MVKNKIIAKLNKYQDIFLVCFSVVILIAICLPLFKSGFFPTHDFIHVARIRAMFEALCDGQFPVRWTNLFRYGDPTFNFYAPLPYYLGAAIKFFGLNYLATVKVMLGLSFVASYLAMYTLGKYLAGKKGGLLAATLYVLAPYRSVDVYVRGAFSEAWAFVFFPLIILYSYKMFKEGRKKDFILFSLSLTGLFVTHNVTSMMFAPFLAIWLVSLIFLYKDKVKLFLKYLLSGLLGMGLSAFYLLPALLEKKFIQTQFVESGYFNFRGHFVSLKQLIVPHWGYQASVWLAADDLSFQLGIAGWLAVSLVGIILILKIVKKETLKKIIIPIILLVLFALSLFMQHYRSAPIWEAIPILAYVQFPWRFMGISVFLMGVVSFVIFNNEKISKWLLVPLLAMAIAFGTGYFHPESYYPDATDEGYVSDATLSRNDKTPKDYLPTGVKLTYEVYDLNQKPASTNKEAKVTGYIKNSKRVAFKIDTPEKTDVRIPLTYFPGWVTYVDNQAVEVKEIDDYGLMVIEVPAGAHDVSIKFTNTPVRQTANIVTLFSLLLIVILVVYPTAVKRKNGN
jgi:hypothetical protein